jgi:hypothetical protein
MTTTSPATWFEQLFGFPEADYAATQSRFEVHGTTLHSKPNGRVVRHRHVQHAHAHVPA